jgi:soluble lytic murein transglycosylase-like protein
MKRLLSLGWLAAMAVLPFPGTAQAQHAEYDALVATHAKANGVPEALVHRVIVRESRYQPGLVGRGGTIGLMQIKLATARGLGYTGDAAGLRDPNTNLTYAVKYLAGAYRVAKGDYDRAVHYFAAGYYYVAKRQRLERSGHPEPVLAAAPSKAAAKEPSKDADASAGQVPK